MTKRKPNFVFQKQTSSTYTERGSQTPAHQMMSDVIKAKQFPNGDPSFFTPTFSLLKNVDDVAVRTPYANNAWVYAACTAITTPLIQLPKVLDDPEDDKGSDVITDNEILTLLEKPNPLMDGPTFWENIMLHLLLPTSKTKGGQCFIVSETFEDEGADLKRGQIPKELYPFSDQFFKPQLDKQGQLMGWKFQLPNTSEFILYKPEEVIRINLVDPANPLAGQSPIWAAKSTLRQDAKSAALNENFFDNNASLGGMLQTDAELEKDVADEIKSDFESKYQGQSASGKVPLLHSGLKYEMFSQTHQDMQFLDQRRWTREEILAVYKVPKFAVALYEDLNLATAKEAVRIFWNQTLLPLDNRILRAFNNQWINFTNNGTLSLKSDLSKVPALQPDLDLKLAQAEKFFKMQVPLSEINRRLDLQLELGNVPWADTFLVSPMLQPAENNLIEPVEEEDPDVSPADNNTDNNPDQPSDNDTDDIDDEEGKTNAPTEEDLKVQLAYNNLLAIEKQASKEEANNEKYHKDILAPDVKKFASILRKYFTQQRNAVLDNIDAWAIQQSKAITKADEDFDKPNKNKLTGSKKEQNKKLQKATAPEYTRQATREGVVVSVELQGLDDWKLKSPTMNKVIKKRLQQITTINTTTFKSVHLHIGQVIDASVSEGLGIKATARRLKATINKVYKGRINDVTIARTETFSIHSQTRDDVYTQEGITKIKWLTSGSDHVRDVDDSDFPHTILDGIVTERKDGFDNGEQIMYPLDPSASAGNVINCECTFIAQK